MLNRHMILGFGAALVLALVTASPAVAADNWTGTWKLNAAKSTFSPGPAPKGMTLAYTPEAGGWKVATEQVDAQGQTTKGGYAGKSDGKDYPWTGNPVADAVVLKRIDDNTFETAWKKGGAVVVTSRAIVSNGGKTLTITQTGKDAQGKEARNTLVLERM
jgi:hypothetical protein